MLRVAWEAYCDDNADFKANGVSVKVLRRPQPKLGDFRHGVEMINAVTRSDVKISPHVCMQIEVSRENV